MKELTNEWIKSTRANLQQGVRNGGASANVVLNLSFDCLMLLVERRRLRLTTRVGSSTHIAGGQAYLVRILGLLQLQAAIQQLARQRSNLFRRRLVSQLNTHTYAHIACQ
jgi:hypothetical protein